MGETLSSAGVVETLRGFHSFPGQVGSGRSGSGSNRGLSRDPSMPSSGKGRSGNPLGGPFVFMVGSSSRGIVVGWSVFSVSVRSKVSS